MGWGQIKLTTIDETEAKIARSAMVKVSPATYLLPSKKVFNQPRASFNLSRFSWVIFVSPMNSTGHYTDKKKVFDYFFTKKKTMFSDEFRSLIT